jgi:hypothetical protein
MTTEERAADGAAEQPFYHVLLIGCDQYPPPQQSLHGCVNDIDAIERLLFEHSSIGIPHERIRVTRLAAPHSGAASTTRFADHTAPPTKPNIVQGLKELAGPEVRQQDRVLIYYSGHGGQTQRHERQGWFECLVGTDERPLYDEELAPLISAITARTDDVTIVLDCCHSGGATRDVYGEPPHGASRFAQHVADDGADPPVLTRDGPAGVGANGLLYRSDPDYLVVVACHADEKAQEDALDGTTNYGFLTSAIVRTIESVSPERREGLRWADIWARLVEEVYRAAATTGRTIQHPWVIGHLERRIFGGPWAPQDPGFLVTELDDGTYRLDCGTLEGVSINAILGVYGRTTDRFPPIGSPEDVAARIGRLRVVTAERSTSTAVAVDAPPRPLPTGVRTRLVEPGQSDRLRVRLDHVDPDPAPVLAESQFLRVVEDEVPEVWVDRVPGGWSMSNEVNRDVATVLLPDGGSAAIVEEAQERVRAGLEGYARYNTVIRLANSCADAELDQSLRLALLDCSDETLVREADVHRPSLPGLARNENGIHEVRPRTPYTIQVSNIYWATLHVTLFNCTALGMVQFLGDVSIKADDVETLWRGQKQGHPFFALPDDPSRDTVDRIVAIATTRPAVSLKGLQIEVSLQQVIDAVRTPRARGSGVTAAYQPELWTAVVVPLRIVIGGTDA